MALSGGGSRKRKAVRKAGTAKMKAKRAARNWQGENWAEQKRKDSTWAQMARRHIGNANRFNACETKRQMLNKAENEVDHITAKPLHKAAKKALDIAKKRFKAVCGR